MGDTGPILTKVIYYYSKTKTWESFGCCISAKSSIFLFGSVIYSNNSPASFFLIFPLFFFSLLNRNQNNSTEIEVLSALLWEQYMTCSTWKNGTINFLMKNVMYHYLFFTFAYPSSAIDKPVKIFSSVALVACFCAEFLCY